MRLVSSRLSDRGRNLIGRAWTSVRVPALRIAVVVLSLLLLYGVWPYVALWNLHLAVMNDDQAALAERVDLDAVRAQIACRLNKDCESRIGAVSGPFIDWLESGIRQHGRDVLQSRVTLEWVQDQLVAAYSGLGLITALSYGFFDSPAGFLVRMQRGDGTPVTLRLELRGMRWRITTVYY